MTRSLFDTLPAKALGRRHAPRRTGPFTLAELERYRAIAAALVIRHGEACLPIFKRLDAECEAMRRESDVLDRVRAIAAGELVS